MCLVTKPAPLVMASGSISPAALPPKHGLGKFFLCKVISCWTSSPAQVIAQTHSTKAKDLGAVELLKRERQP